MYRLLRSLKRDARGATAVEYGLIIAMVVLAVITAINSVATRTNGMWNNVANAVNKS
ncbi:MAG: Flp family type IVb pilin [Sphingobium sp.]